MTPEVGVWFALLSIVASLVSIGFSLRARWLLREVARLYGQDDGA